MGIDSLNRLATAITAGWSETDEYDGFNNLTSQSGAPYNIAVLYNLNNRQTTDVADAAGNILNVAGGASYDIENRLKTANNGLAAYAYNTGNKRVWRGIWNTSQVQTTDEVTFWLGGQRTATYSLSYVSGALQATQTGTWYYFAGKLIKNANGYVHTDRLGSIGKFYPYGQERTATTNGTDKFATYFRDSETGLDYADQRYHQPGWGRFLTPDPFGGSAHLRSPGTWNRYAYVTGDPINGTDSHGLCEEEDFCSRNAGTGYPFAV
jgi:RHS repeat-associated protein